MTKAGQPVFQSLPDSYPEERLGEDYNCAPLHAEDAEATALQCLDSIAGLYPALDILCFRALQCAPYKSPMYERISKIHGMLEAACDLARREGSK